MDIRVWILLFLVYFNSRVDANIECQEGDVECHEKQKYTKGSFKHFILYSIKRVQLRKY